MNVGRKVAVCFIVFNCFDRNREWIVDDSKAFFFWDNK